MYSQSNSSANNTENQPKRI